MAEITKKAIDKNKKTTLKNALPNSIDAVCAFVEKSKPKHSASGKEQKRNENVAEAIKKLASIAFECDKNAKIFIESDELPLVCRRETSGANSSAVSLSNDALFESGIVVHIECGKLSIVQADVFADAINVADHIIIVPLTNGNVKISFGFAVDWNIGQNKAHFGGAL